MSIATAVVCGRWSYSVFNFMSSLQLHFILVALLAAFGCSAKAPGHGRRVVCYMASWGIYLEGPLKFDIEDTELALPMCTHLVYLFASLDSASLKIKSTDTHRDVNLSGMMRTIALKEKHPHLRVMICIGGWDDGSINYSTMVSKPETRADFIESVVSFLLKNKFDGIDVNWQFPGDRGGSATDGIDFVALIKEMRVALDQHSLILSVAVTSFPYRIDLGTDGKALSEHAHFLNILSYEYHGWWDNKVGPSTPLYAADNFCINGTIHRYLEMGAPSHKLNLGLSSYGITYLLSNPAASTDTNIVGQRTTGQGFKGTYGGGGGFMAFNDFCLESEAGGWSEVWDDVSATPFFINQAKVFSVDNSKSFTEKVPLIDFLLIQVKYAMDQQLGGIIYYGLDKDDFRGACKASGGPYPSLRRIHKALVQYSTFDDLHELLKRKNAHYFWNGMKS